MLELKVLH